MVLITPGSGIEMHPLSGNEVGQGLGCQCEEATYVFVARAPPIGTTSTR